MAESAYAFTTSPLGSCEGGQVVRIGEDTLMPTLAFGAGTAWFNANAEKGEVLSKSITKALDVSFMHIDDAEMYRNEKHVKAGLQAWFDKPGNDRSKLFITGKVLNVDGPGGVRKVCSDSLESSGLEYYDLYLVHAPFQTNGQRFSKTLSEVWSEMEALVDHKLVRHIGVSNFRIPDLEQLASARIKPCCNQVECHPYLQQLALHEYCRTNGILSVSYSPLASITKVPKGPVDEPVEAAAKRLGSTAAQVLIRWNLQTGHAVVTTSSSELRMREYLGVWDISLSEDEIAAISKAGQAAQKRVYWTQCPQFQMA